MLVEKNFNWAAISLARFILALIVTLGHLNGLINVGFLKYVTYLGSFEAILGFLLISGFSIGRSLRRDSSGYLKRRFQRIYPVYIVSIIFQLLVSGFIFQFKSFNIIIINLLFLNNIVTNNSIVGPAWTLAMEFSFYLIAPLLLFFNTKWLLIAIYISFVFYLFFTCGRTLYHWSYYSGTKYGVNILALAFIWIAGFKLAIDTSKPFQNRFLIACLFAGHIIITYGIQLLYRIKHHETKEILNFDLINLIANCICLFFTYYVVVFNFNLPHFSPKTSQILNLLGNLSYPLYLTHFTTFELLRKWNVSNGMIMFFSSLFVSLLIYELFDIYSKKRQIKFGSKFFFLLN